MLDRTKIKKALACGAALLPLVSAGCANVVDGTTRTEIVRGTPSVERAEARPSLVFASKDSNPLEVSNAPLAEPVFRVSAVVVEPVTVRTPQTRRETQEIIPFDGVGELAEWTFSVALGWVPLLEGTITFSDYVDGINPAKNSPHFTQRRETATLSETPVAPEVEERHETRRVSDARVALGFPGLPKVQLNPEDEATLTLSMDRLLTRPLPSAPKSIEAFLAVEGYPKRMKVAAAITPELGERLFRASRGLSSMDETKPASVAQTVLDLEQLGFEDRSKSIEGRGAKRHGTAVMARAIADVHVAQARAANARNDGRAAMAALEQARARVDRGPRDWDLLEADLHEADALRAIDEKDYARARSGLLKASRLDSARQQRLSGFLAIAIEAMDRKTAADQQASQVMSATAAHAVPAAAAQHAPSAADVVEQCLAREAALQACRVVPGFGKDICKSGVRAQYSHVACL